MKMIKTESVLMNTERTIGITRMNNIEIEEGDNYQKITWKKFKDIHAKQHFQRNGKDRYNPRFLKYAKKMVEGFGYKIKNVEVWLPEGEWPLLITADKNLVVAIAPTLEV